MELTESRKRIIIDLISEFKKNDTYSLWKTDFNNFFYDESEERIITEILKYKLKLISSANNDMYRLTQAGIIFSSFENIEKEQLSNKIDEEIKILTLQKLKFEQIPAKFWWLIIIITAIISILTTWVNNQISKSENQQEQPKKEILLQK